MFLEIRIFQAMNQKTQGKLGFLYGLLLAVGIFGHQSTDLLDMGVCCSRPEKHANLTSNMNSHSIRDQSLEFRKHLR